MKKNGFTLIELLLYISLTAFILISVMTFLALLLQSRIKNQTILDVDNEGTRVMQIVTQTIRNADTINASGNSLSLTTGGVTTIFDLSSGIVRIKEGAGAAVPLTSSRVVVSGLSFTDLTRPATPGVIRVSYTITHANPSGRNEYDYAKTFYGSAALR